MADKKISDLNAAAPPVLTDLLEVSQLAQMPMSRKLTFQALMDWIASAFGLTSGVKVYRALLTQTGADNPVAVVFENSLGGVIAWVRDFGGYYHGTLANAFPGNKTFIMMNNHTDFILSGSPVDAAVSIHVDSSTIGIITGSAGSDSESDCLLNHCIEIRVYP